MKTKLTFIMIMITLFLGGCFSANKENQEEKEQILMRSKFEQIVDLMKKEDMKKRSSGSEVQNGVFIYSESRQMEEFYGVSFLVKMTTTDISQMLTEMYKANSLGKTACFALMGKALKYSKIGNYSSPEDFNIPITELISKDSIVYDMTLNKKIQADGDQDIEAPILTLKGNNLIKLDLNSNYVEYGVTAIDEIDGDITNKVQITGNVNVNVTGIYNVIYNVTDTAGNKAIEIKRVIEVGDFNAPVITLKGNNLLTISVGEEYIEYGATALDNVDGNITENIIINKNDLNILKPGIYEVFYNVSDLAGNKALEVKRTIKIVDTESPLITLKGEDEVTILKGDSYVEYGATALDNVDGNITENIEIDSNIINTDIAGMYKVTYNVSDLAGNKALEKTRIVNVVERYKIIPTLTPNVVMVFDILNVSLIVTDSNIVKVEIKEPILDISLNLDIVNGTASGEMEIAKGTEELKMIGKDSSGNIIENLLIKTTDDFQGFQIMPGIEIPVITLQGASEITLTRGTSYTEYGATATDNEDGDITGNIEINTSEVNTSVVGIYEVKYNVNDSSGNSATEVKRIVRVVKEADTEAPVIILKGASEITLTRGTSYTEYGATATDNEDGDITGNIEINTSEVNTSVVGIYEVRYNVNDASGNSAIEIKRIVKIVEESLTKLVPTIGSEIIMGVYNHLTIDIQVLDTNIKEIEIADSLTNWTVDVVDGSANKELEVAAGETKVTFIGKDTLGNIVETIEVTTNNDFETYEVIKVVQEEKITGTIQYNRDGLITNTEIYDVNLMINDDNVKKIEFKINTTIVYMLEVENNTVVGPVILTNETGTVILLAEDENGNVLFTKEMELRRN